MLNQLYQLYQSTKYALASKFFRSLLDQGMRRDSAAAQNLSLSSCTSAHISGRGGESAVFSSSARCSLEWAAVDEIMRPPGKDPSCAAIDSQSPPRSHHWIKTPATLPQKCVKIANFRGAVRGIASKSGLWAFSTIAGLSLLTPLSFQLNLQLNSEHGDLASFVMNGEWAILGKAPKKDPFSVFVTFPAFSRLAVDLTLYCRPVFDTLTKVSSRRNISRARKASASKISLVAAWFPLTAESSSGSPQLCTECSSDRTPDNTLLARGRFDWFIGSFPNRLHNLSRDQARRHAFFKFSCFQLNLLVKAEKGDLSTFVTNGEWHLLGEIVVCLVQRNNRTIANI